MGKRWLALGLALAVLLAALCGCRGPALLQSQEIVRPEVRFSEMEYRRPDRETLLSDLAVLHDRVLEGDETQREAALEEIARLEHSFLTQYTLMEIRSAMDTADPYCRQELEALSSLRAALVQQEAEFNQKLLENPALASVLLTPEERTQAAALARWATPEVGALLEQEAALCQQYRQSLAAAIPQESAQAFCDAYYKEWSGLFLSLCAVRQQLAAAAGEGDYVRLAYARMGRSWGEEEAVAFRRQIKEQLAPLYQQLLRQRAEEMGLARFPFAALDALAPLPEWESDISHTLEGFRQVYTAMSPRTGAAAAYLLEQELYDLAPREHKSPGGFQAYLYDYASPFLFGTFRGNAEDVFLFAHEFGHWYAAFEKIDPTRHREGDRAMELKEFHSGGMEVLTLRWYPVFFGAAAPAFQKARLLELFTLILDCCVYDEWQHAVYHDLAAITAAEDPAGELDRLLAEIRREYYGEPDYTGWEPFGAGKMWIQKAHVFETPFYMLDYALAYTAALSLYDLSCRDWEDAFSRYDRLVHFAPGPGLAEEAAAVGLPDPFSREAGEKLAGLFRRLFLP